MIELELLEPPKLLELIRSFENNKFCIDCQTVGHLNWESFELEAMKQMYICGECTDALAMVEFLHDMVRVIKQGLTPRYPQNFQHWIDILSTMKTGQGLYDPGLAHDKKAMSNIQKIKDKKIEFSFCKTRPHDIRKGGKANVEVPEPCKNNVIIHNHPSGSTNMSENDKLQACTNNSIMCVVTPEKTVCYEPCTNTIVEEIEHEV